MNKPVSNHLTARGLLAARCLRLTAGGALAVPWPVAPCRNVAAGRSVERRGDGVGIPNGRLFPLKDIAQMEAEFVAAMDRQLAPRSAPLAGLPQLQLLAVSGGGEDGALVRACCAAGPRGHAPDSIL